METNQIGGSLNFQITNTSSNLNRKFNCTTTNISFSSNSKNFETAHSDIENAFRTLYAEFISQMGDKDKIRIIFFHDSLESPISLPFMSKTALTAEGFELCKPDNPVLNIKVDKIATDLKLPDTSYVIEEIKKIENYLKDYQITIINCDGKLDKHPIYIGEPKNKFIYLTITGSHYKVITSMKAFYNRSYYCDFCKIAYQNVEKHKCKNMCNSCNRQKCAIETAFKCENVIFCVIMRNVVIFTQKIVIHFFDYEAYIDNGIHVPNLVMAKKVCIECLNGESECGDCEKKYIFYENKSFCEWLFSQDNYIAIAHNLIGYDGIFIINHLISSFLPTDSMPNIILIVELYEGKQEADGYPDYFKTDEDKDLYIKNYYEREGILLDKDKIEYNKGLRSVMKGLLNSFWGRFGMNTNKTKYRLISKPDEWFEMISDDQYIIDDVDFSHPNFIQVFYSKSDELHDSRIHTSVTLFAFVTCHARLKLYHELKKIGNRVLYFITDSIIYINREGEYDPP
ncbi:unnamed protein product [Brachionus calyciflorus]|uniref:DNA-directed DNA polymerase n=1 Tax=Brachionus calyciflorus TaxID=104777 RepID=A0A813SM71_9BILA|nr:unnamed protein product [Brachionus calyciflorus]